MKSRYEGYTRAQVLSQEVGWRSRMMIPGSKWASTGAYIDEARVRVFQPILGSGNREPVADGIADVDKLFDRE